MARPISPGRLADNLFELVQRRRELSREIDSIKALETEIKKELTVWLKENESTSIAGVRTRVTRKLKPVPNVTNWNALYKYIARTKSFDLLQRRLTSKAVEERRDAGKKVTGVEWIEIPTWSFAKVK